jgi:glutamine phosphoribosylpyrophosphate amidotransferase
MGGLFGFVGTQVDVSLLGQAALLASRRGPHAFGFAWRVNGAFQARRFPGPAERNLSALKEVAGPVIGQCRLATDGTGRVMNNHQPLVGGDAALVHNGNVDNAPSIFKTLDYHPMTQSDSEAILAGLLRTQGALRERLRRSLATVPPNPLAVIVLSEQGLTVVRRWHPLYQWRLSGRSLPSR